jgi:hypothetical protein
MFPVSAIDGALQNYTTERAIAAVRPENSQRENAQDSRTPQQRAKDVTDRFAADIAAAREQRNRINSLPVYKGRVIEPNVESSLLAFGNYSIFVEENGRYVERQIATTGRTLSDYINSQGEFDQTLFDRDVERVKSMAAGLSPNSSATPDGAIISADLSKKVRLVPVTQRVGEGAQGGSGIVEFDIAPDMSEERQVNYLAISEIRAPGSLHLYMGTQGRTFTINAKLVTTNDEQARANYDKLVALRAMTLPEKGYVGVLGDEGPPIPVRLYGYGMRLHGIPCVVTSLSIPYPEDVDYYYFDRGGVQTGMPIVNTISVTLQEIRSADELLEQFDINAFRSGDLPGW